MRSFLKMTWFELKLFSREPFAFFFTLAFPLVVLFIFGSIFGNDPVDFLNGRGTVDNSVPGYIGMIIGSLALLSLPVGLATYREKGILRRLRATPVSSLTIIGTQIIVHLLMLVIGVALLFAAGLLVFDLSLPQSFINMLIAVLIGSASFFAFGFLLAAVLPEFIAAGGSLAVLGAGDPALEAAMRQAAERWPGRVGVRIGYDEALAHRMFGGGDAVLVPSRFEPCGLTQMYGLRYGTIPVVAATGGLNDTVIGATPASLSARAATGVSFHPVDKTAFAGALRQVSRLYADRSGWTSLMKRAMKAEVGWEAPAARYAELYRSLLP